MPNIQKTFTLNSFFAGGGLLDFAFKDLFNIHLANELNPSAATCYRHNIGNHICVDDIENIDIDQIPYADAFIGGAPCVDYSSIGANRGEWGKTGKLIFVYQQIIAIKRPKAFLFENVAGLARKHKKTLYELIGSYQKLGYNISAKFLDASEFGAAQSRKRVFVVGIRKDLGFFFRFPNPSLQRKSTVQEAIGDLPMLPIGSVVEVFPNHYSNWESPSPKRILELMEFPSRNQRTPFRQLRYDTTSHTLTAHIAKDGREFLHPTQPRRITVRECLRLMGMPDSFVIPDNVSISNQYKIVGNGVAFPVAASLATSLHEQLLACR